MTTLKSCWLLLFAACSSGGTPGAPEPLPPYQALIPNKQARLDLGSIALRQSNEALEKEGHIDFHLDDRYPLAGAKLSLHDLWYSAEVWIDEEFIGQVDGGSFPAVIELGDRLRPGPHRLGLRVRSPGKKSGFLLGSRKEVDFDKASVGKIELHLAPAVHIDWLALPLKKGLLHAKAFVPGAPEGARVRLEAGLDGTLSQSLGEAPVVNEFAELGAIEWQGERWDASTGSGALYQFVATLLDREGKQLDQRIVRSGLKESEHSSEGFTVNGKLTPFVAVRMEENWKKNRTNIDELLQAGVNSIEIHGSYPPRSWLELSDEAGVQVVMLPRCDGGVMAQSENVRAERAKVLQQHEALALATLHHPSLMFWTTEGEPDLMRSLAASFSNDPLSRMVTGGSIPAASLSNQHPHLLKRLKAGSWITEITISPGIDSLNTFDLFREALNRGAMGGVLPVDRNHIATKERWLKQLDTLNKDLGIPRDMLQRRRSMSRVSILGIKTGTPIWLEAPLTMPVGTLASSDGAASLACFYAGKADLVQGSNKMEVLLSPDEREGGRVFPETRKVQWMKP